MHLNFNNETDLEEIREIKKREKEELIKGLEAAKTPDGYSLHSEQRVMSIGDGESSAGKAIGIIFVIYFIISLILLVATSNNDKNLCLIVFGQLFVVFGFVALLSSIKNIKNKKYRIAQRISTFLMSLLFVLIGASVGGVGFLKKTGNYDSFMEEFKNTISGGNPDFNFAKLGAVFFISIFILIGIILMVKTPLRLSRLRKVATVTVHAKIVDYVKNTSSKTRTYYKVSKYPIWEYIYGGDMYRVASIFPVENFDKSMIGTKEGIVYLDPENPAESITAEDYNGEKNINKGDLAMGAFFAGLATLMLICVFAAM